MQESISPEKPFSDEKLGGALLAAPGGVRDASGSRKRLPSRANLASAGFSPESGVPADRRDVRKERIREDDPFVSTQIPKFGIVLVLVVVLVLGALGFRDRKETDGTNLFC